MIVADHLDYLQGQRLCAKDTALVLLYSAEVSCLCFYRAIVAVVLLDSALNTLPWFY